MRTSALFILALSACRGFDATPPEGFAIFDDWTQFRAVSADGIMYMVRTEDNEPEAKLDFWKEALKNGFVADTKYEAVDVSKGVTQSEEELTAPLYEEIGRLKMDIKWLEKKL